MRTRPVPAVITCGRNFRHGAFVTIGTGMANFRRQDTTDNSSYFTKDTATYNRKSINSLLVNIWLTMYLAP